MSIGEIISGNDQQHVKQFALMKTGNSNIILFGYPEQIVKDHIVSVDNYEIWGYNDRSKHMRLLDWLTIEFVAPTLKEINTFAYLDEYHAKGISLYPMKIEGTIYSPVNNTILHPCSIDKIITKLGSLDGTSAIRKELLETKKKYGFCD